MDGLVRPATFTRKTEAWLDLLRILYDPLAPNGRPQATELRHTKRINFSQQLASDSQKHRPGLAAGANHLGQPQRRKFPDSIASSARGHPATKSAKTVNLTMILNAIKYFSFYNFHDRIFVSRELASGKLRTNKNGLARRLNDRTCVLRRKWCLLFLLENRWYI